MTKAEAEKILQKPKFGDAKCIEAVARLEDEPEVARMREFLRRRGIHFDDGWDLDELRRVAERAGL